MKKKITLFVSITSFFILILSCSVSAQNNKITLKTNKTYSAYDVTSDGKKDRIRINDFTAGKSKCSIIINGKTVWKSKLYELGRISSAHIFTINKKNYIHILGESQANDWNLFDYLFIYKKGKLTIASNFLDHLGGANVARYENKGISVSEKKLILTVCSQPYGIGRVRYKVTYKQYGDHLIPTTSTYKLLYGVMFNPYITDNCWTAKRKLTVYGIPGAIEPLTSIRKGEIVSVTDIRFESGSAYIKIKFRTPIDGDKWILTNGWIKCEKKYRYQKEFFQETIYV